MRPHVLSRPLTVVVGVLVALVAAVVLAPRALAAEASMWVTRANGSVVPENGTIRTGERITIHVKDFAPGATVLLQVGQAQLPSGIDTDATGAGSTGYTAPALKSDVYVITASSDTDATTYVVSLFNPKNPQPKPAPTPTRKPTATTHSSASGSGTRSSATSRPSNGSSSGTLAKTGPVQPPYWVAALVLLVVGGSLVKVAAPVLLGRHERIGGAHLRPSGRRLRD